MCTEACNVEQRPRPRRGATPRKGLADTGALLHLPMVPAELLRGAPRGAAP